ncbi:MAG: hypothetical protein ACRD82_06835 [Blastocatellia bacterium]
MLISGCGLLGLRDGDQATAAGIKLTARILTQFGDEQKLGQYRAR